MSGSKPQLGQLLVASLKYDGLGVPEAVKGRVLSELARSVLSQLLSQCGNHPPTRSQEIAPSFAISSSGGEHPEVSKADHWAGLQRMNQTFLLLSLWARSRCAATFCEPCMVLESAYNATHAQPPSRGMGEEDRPVKASLKPSKDHCFPLTLQ